MKLLYICLNVLTDKKMGCRFVATPRFSFWVFYERCLITSLKREANYYEFFNEKAHGSDN